MTLQDARNAGRTAFEQGKGWDSYPHFDGDHALFRDEYMQGWAEAWQQAHGATA